MKLFGREEALTALEGLLSQAAGGEPVLGFVTGEAGSGKTVLIEAALASFPGRSRIGRCFPGGAIPLKPWMDILGRRGGQPEDIEALTGALLQAATPGPSCLVVEDLHHADTASLDLLLRLADRLRDEPLAIVGSYCPEGIPRDHPLRRVRSQLRSLIPFTEVPLPPLDPAATLALVEHLLGGPVHVQLAQQLHDRGQGNPLFLVELCDTLAREDRLIRGSQGWQVRLPRELPVPESIRDAFAHRLDALAPAARRVVEAAAVMGPEFDLHRLLRLEDEPVGLDALVDGGWIDVSSGAAGRFRQSLAREAILREMTWSRRGRLHERMARLLDGEGAPPAEIAAHYLACGDREQARAFLVAAAEQCCGLHAYDDAFRLFHQALDGWPPGAAAAARVDALRRMAACAQTSGRLEDAARAWREILDADPDDAGARGEAFRALASVLEQQGRFRATIGAREDAAACFEQAGRLHDAAAARFAAGQVLMCQALHRRGFEAFSRAGELAERADDPALRSNALGESAVSAAMLGNADEALARIDRSLQVAMEHNLTDAAAEAYRRRAIIYDYLSDLPKEKAAFHDAVTFCRMNGVKAQERLCLACMAFGLFRMGDWPESLSMCREIIDDPHLDLLSKGLANLTKGLIHVHRGEYRPGQGRLMENLDASRSYGYLAGEFFSLWGLALIDEAEQRPEQAEARYRQVLDLWSATDDRHDVLDPLCAAASFFAARDRPADLQRCCQAAGRIAAETGNAEAAAALAWCLGGSAAAADQLTEAAEHFRQALQAYERLSLPARIVAAAERLQETAYALADPAAAAAHGRKGLGIARRLGMRPAIRRIEALLARCGNHEPTPTPPSSARALLDQLTPRQREVTDELAKGLTNKEIASRLRLSVRTVDMHVRHVLERLNCRTRAEAIRILLESADG